MKKWLSLFLSLLLFSLPLFADAVEFEQGMELSTADSDVQTLARELIVTGSHVWQVVDTTLLCHDALTGAAVASLPLSSAFPGTLYRFSLLSSTQDTILLCAAFLNEPGDCSVRLLEFGLDEINRIELRSSRDCSDSLGFFYSPDSGILQVEMVSFNGGLLVTAIDEDFYCHLCWVAPDLSEITELTQLPFDMLTAVLPWSNQLLLAGDSLSSDSVLSLSTLSIPKGDLASLAEIPTGASASAQNFAWDPATNQLFFTLYNAAWRVSPREGQSPEPIAVFPEEPAAFGKGAIASGRYFFQSESGDLLSCDTRAVLPAAPLRIVNVTENTEVAEAAARFNAAQEDCFLFVETLAPETSLQQKLEILRQADGAVLSLSSPECRELLCEEYYVDFSVSPLLSEAVSEMALPVRRTLTRGESLLAFPVSLETPCLTLNLPAMEALTGLSPESLPRDWQGFLALLDSMAESSCFEAHPEYAISMPGISSGEFRQIMAIYLLRSVLLEASLQQDLSLVSETLPPLLKAFRSVNWTRLGLLEDPSESDVLDEEAVPVIGEEQFEITTAYRDPDTAFWPLSAATGRDSVIPQQITVLVLNQQSAHQDDLLHWADSLWDQSEASFRLSLCPQMKELVPNDEYQATVDDLQDMLGQYESWLAEITDPKEAEIIRSEADDLRNYLESYRTEAMWIVSEESLVAYRSQTFAPDPFAFWKSERDLETLDHWLAGDLSDEDLISWVRTLLSEP